MKGHKSNTILRLLIFGKPYIFWLILTLIFSLAGIVLTILASWYLGKVSETAISMELSRFIPAVVPMVMIFLLQTPLSFVITYASARFADFAIFRLRNKITEHIQNLPLNYIEKNSTSDLLSRLNSDVGIFQQFLQGSMLQLVVLPLTFAACASFLFYLSFELSLVSFSAIPVFMVIAMAISKPLEKYAKEVQETIADMTGVAQSSISGMPEAKSFNLEKTLDEKFDKSVDRSVSKGLLMSEVVAFINPVNGIMQTIPFLLVYFYGGFLVIAGRLTFAEFIMFLNLSNAVVEPLRNFPQALSSYRMAKASGSRIFEILDNDAEKTGAADNTEASCNGIEIKDVFICRKFLYAGAKIACRFGQGV